MVWMANETEYCPVPDDKRPPPAFDAYKSIVGNRFRRWGDWPPFT